MGKRFERKIAEGWTLIKEYPRFNLWRRNATGIRECFRKDEVPTVKIFVEEA